jgi:hypothetical protein
VFTNCSQNDTCGTALEIVSGSSVLGNTGGADEGILWYSFTGTGGTVTASTCYSGTDVNFDTYLEIYSEDCNNLAFEFANDDDFSCPTTIFHSTVSGFVTLPGVDYHLNVQGFYGPSCTGAFELVFAMTPGPPSSPVPSALPTSSPPAPSASPSKAPKGSGGKNGGKQNGGGKQSGGGKNGGKQKGGGKNRGLRE